MVEVRMLIVYVQCHSRVESSHSWNWYAQNSKTAFIVLVVRCTGTAAHTYTRIAVKAIH